MGLLSRQKFILFQRSLLLDPLSCPKEEVMPVSFTEWNIFIKLVIRNRLSSVFYHFLECRNCQKKIPKKIYFFLSKKYYKLIFSHHQSEILKRKFDKKLKQKKVAVFVLKDCAQIQKLFTRYYVLKFDLDVYGSERNFPHVYSLLQQWGYTCYRGSNKNGLVDQYEFVSNNITSPAVPIEYRYTLFSSLIHQYQAKKSRFYLIDRWVYRKLQIEKSGLHTLKIYDDFFLRTLLYFLEDKCMSLRNLFDIYVLLSTSINSWKRIEKVSKKYEVYDIVLFVTLLSKKLYEKKNSTSPKIPSPPFSVKLALYLTEVYVDIYNPLISGEIIHADQKNSYLFSIISGLLVSEKIQAKIFFFLFPQRFIYLFYIMLKVSLLKLIS